VVLGCAVRVVLFRAEIMVGSEGRMKVTKGKVKRAVRKAGREHVVMAERLLREGDAVKDSEGVEIEARYRHAALLAAAEELRTAATLVERVAWASVGALGR
jgi:hypothetical protein